MHEDLEKLNGKENEYMNWIELQDLLKEKLRLYCKTCNKPLREIERYSVLQVDEEGNVEIDLSGFCCECEEGEENSIWVLERVTRQKDLVIDFVRDYMNGVDNLETIIKNLIFWKEHCKEKGIDPNDYLERELE